MPKNRQKGDFWRSINRLRVNFSSGVPSYLNLLIELIILVPNLIVLEKKLYTKFWRAKDIYYLYSSIREKFENYPKNESDLAGLLSDLNSCPNKTTSFARAVNSILSTNESYTAYYKIPEFHDNTGNCVIL